MPYGRAEGDATTGQCSLPVHSMPPAGCSTPLLALLCSSKCPGRVIVRLYDLARRLRDEGIPVIGGFHSSMEKEALEFLLRGSQPVVWVPARHLGPRSLKPDEKRAIDDGRLTVVSLFGQDVKRATRTSAAKRNAWVVEHAAAVFVAHAEPGGLVAAAANRASALGKPIATFAGPASGECSGIAEPNIQRLDIDEIVAWWRQTTPHAGTGPS